MTPPELWTTYGRCKIYPKTIQIAGENPYQIEASDRSDVEAAVREIENWLRPASEKYLRAWTAELYLKTAKQKTNDDDFRAQQGIYARGLVRYPADIVRDALRGWRGTFFPAFAEIVEVIEKDRRIAERVRRKRYLQEWLDAEQTPPQRKTIDPARLDEIKRRIDAKYDGE